jgi:heat shock protein HslJ
MYDDGSGQLVNVMPSVEVTALFADDGRVSGSASCNNYVSLYTIEGDNLTVSLPAMTRQECVNPPDIMLQETGYLGDLTVAVSYQIKGSELQLLDEEGRIILTYLAS